MTESERIDALLHYLGDSARALSINLELKSPQVFYDIRSGKCGISKDLSRRILDKYPEINSAWLITGEGTMLNSSPEKDCSNQNELDNLNTEELMTIAKVLQKETAMQKEQIADLKEQVDFLKSLINKQ